VAKRFIIVSLFRERLHVTPELELNEYPSSKKLLDSILKSSTRDSPSWFYEHECLLCTLKSQQRTNGLM